MVSWLKPASNDRNIVGFTNHLVYASSSSVYGGNIEMPFSEHHVVDHPVSLYAATKKANELMAHTYSHLFQLPTTGLRFFTVYGPWGRPDMALFMFTKAILAGEPIKVFNHGRMVRDFTYVDDIANRVLHTLDRPPQADPGYDKAAADTASSWAPYRVFNIGNNNPVQLMDFIAAIERHTGKTAEKVLMDIQPGGRAGHLCGRFGPDGLDWVQAGHLHRRGRPALCGLVSGLFRLVKFLRYLAHSVCPAGSAHGSHGNIAPSDPRRQCAASTRSIQEDSEGRKPMFDVQAWVGERGTGLA